MATGIVTFLQTRRSKEDLKIALDVLREFKGCESSEEYLTVMFASWAKLEQFEEFLDHLVNGSKLRPDILEG